MLCPAAEFQGPPILLTMVSSLRSFAAEVNLVFYATFSNARVRIYWGLDSHILDQGEDSWGRNIQQLLFLPSLHPLLT